MLTLTKPQRRALKAVYDRTPLFQHPHDRTYSVALKYFPGQKPVTYRQFRKTVIPFDYGAIGVHWCGMWLGIETDGYTHS